MLTKLNIENLQGQYIEMVRKQVCTTIRVVTWDYTGRILLSKMYDGETLRRIYFLQNFS